MGMNGLVGCLWHIGRYHLSEGDDRRDSRRCVFYNKRGTLCEIKTRKCTGSAHCEYYSELPIKRTMHDERIQEVEHSLDDALVKIQNEEKNRPNTAKDVVEKSKKNKRKNKGKKKIRK